MATDKHRVYVAFSDEEYEKLTKFLKENGYANRSQGLAQLAMIGLELLGDTPPDPTPKRPTRKKRKKEES